MKGPEIFTIEKAAHDHIERRLEPVETKEDVDKNEALKEAQKALVGNEKLYTKFLRAMLNRDQHHDAKGLTEIDNIFIAYLQDLSESEIDNIVRQFNSGFIKFVASYAGNIEINSEQKRKMFENNEKNNREIRGNIHPKSIKNVISFIRSRKKLLDIEPSQQYGFYVESTLDSNNKIDLIECIFNDEKTGKHISTMNLIQIKSSIPPLDEQSEIMKSHKEWVHSSVMDLDALEKEYSDNIPQNLAIETLAQNSEEISNLLLEMCTNPDGFNPHDFITSLQLEKLSNKHKAWLIIKYGKILQDEITDAVQTGMIEESDAQKIMSELDTLETEIRKKAKYPKNLSYIDSINSIIAVGPQIVHEENLLTHTDDERKQKMVKIM